MFLINNGLLDWYSYIIFFFLKIDVAKIPGFEGKLFEPTNVLINEKVHEKAMEVFGDLPLHGEYLGEIWLKFGHRPWIGFNDQVLEGKFINDHSGKSPSINVWFPGEPSHSGGLGNENCAEFNLLEKPLWNDDNCSVEQLSICEFVPSD